MNKNNDWITSLENEISQVEAIEKRLKETNLDRDTQEIIKQRILSYLQLDQLNKH